MPLVSAEDWQRPAEALDRLRAWAEGEAGQAIEWYLRDKATKRFGSRVLRALAIAAAVAGGVAPLVTAGRAQVTPWGYVLLAVAAGCVAFDHFFGLSSSWMRDMNTVRALQSRLVDFRFEWVNATAEQTFNLEKPDALERLELIRHFAANVGDLINAETGEWLSEFQTNVGQLRAHTERTWPGGHGLHSEAAEDNRHKIEGRSAQPTLQTEKHPTVT
jgi:hypothetical protein